MAGGNGTGPLGIGPMTGRGFGPCDGGYSSRKPRLGRRPGFGRCYGYYGSYLNKSDSMGESVGKNFIEKEKAVLEARLKNINDMLDKL
ncbi:MAG: DUF5320 domain-containing protein [Peptostreptococcales bacterium]